MHSIRASILAAIAFITSAAEAAEADRNSTCLSYGIDFQDGGHYFINSNSTQNFTSVSQFAGCNTDNANVWFIPPSGKEIECSRIPTTPENTGETSTCPIQKNQLSEGSGIYKLIIFGNNGDGNPYGFQRDFNLKIGTQLTRTTTPTSTITATRTPHSRSTLTRTVVITSTLNATTTYTIGGATAPCTKSILPKAVTTSITKTITFHEPSIEIQPTAITKTKTARCTVPPRSPYNDPYIRHSPKNFTPEVLQDAKYVRLAWQQRRIVKRAPDAPTITVTYSPPVLVTTTVAVRAVTNTLTVSVTSTTFTHLKPSTIRKGTVTHTTVISTPTRTVVNIKYITDHPTSTRTVRYHVTTTVTPAASRAACRAQGGHFGNGFEE